jgi:arylsulfatase A-like enzyme
MAGSLPAQSRRGGGRTRPPNILYVMTDQQKASASPLYGNPHVPSPFLAELARQGIVFKDAYVPSPICTPSRTSVLTGVHPLVHDVTCHQNRAPFNLAQLPELLKEAGYHTAAVGHYENARNLTRGWDDEISHDETGIVRGAFAKWFGLGRKDLGWSSGRIDCTPEQGHAHILTSRAIDAIDGIKAVGRPFFLHVAYLEPHPPYFAPPPYDTLVDPARVPLPAARSGAATPAWQLQTRRECGSDRITEAELRQMIAIYYGMIAYADAEMRRLHQALAERGLLDNTWIVFSADHGDYLGEKGLFMKTESLYECLLHVPLVIVPPPGIKAPRGETVSGLVDNTDLFATMLGMAGRPIPEYTQGHDLVAWLNGSPRRPLRDALYAQVGNYRGGLGSTFPNGLPASGRHRQLLQGVRTAEFSYIRDPDYGDEAYDLRTDPFELDNLLARGGSRAPEVDGLRRRVDDWEGKCLRLKERIGVVPGYRGFVGE